MRRLTTWRMRALPYAHTRAGQFSPDAYAIGVNVFLYAITH